MFKKMKLKKLVKKYKKEFKTLIVRAELIEAGAVEIQRTLKTIKHLKNLKIARESEITKLKNELSVLKNMPTNDVNSKRIDAINHDINWHKNHIQEETTGVCGIEAERKYLKQSSGSDKMLVASRMYTEHILKKLREEILSIDPEFNFNTINYSEEEVASIYFESAKNGFEKEMESSISAAEGYFGTGIKGVTLHDDGVFECTDEYKPDYGDEVNALIRKYEAEHYTLIYPSVAPDMMEYFKRVMNGEEFNFPYRKTTLSIPGMDEVIKTGQVSAKEQKELYDLLQS